MNRTYKVIWSKARRCYVVVSELAKGQHKSSSNSEQISSNVHRGGYLGKAALAAVAAGLLTFGGMAYSPVMAAGSGDTDTLINKMSGNYNHPDRNLIIKWTDSKLSDGAAIRNVDVNAKNITVEADFKGNQWNNKGVITDKDKHTNITASGNINITSYDDSVYTQVTGTTTIEGFKNLIIKSTDGFGLVDNGGGITVNGEQGSTVDITSYGKPGIGNTLRCKNPYFPPFIVPDLVGKGITINSDKIKITSPDGSIFSGRTKNDTFKVSLNASDIDLNGRVEAYYGDVFLTSHTDGTVTIKDEEKGSISATNGSKVTINEKAQGLVQLDGKISAGSGASVLANMTGTGSYLNVDSNKNAVEVSGNKSNVTLNMEGNDSYLKGNILTQNKGQADIKISGNSASFTGSLKAAGTSTAKISVTNQGNWKGSAHTNDKAVTSVALANGSIWNITENSNVSAMDLSSGAVASLSGSAHSLNMGNLKASGVPGTFAMDLTYHDNNVSTYENATDSDFLYAHDGSGSTFTVQPTAIASVNTMKSGDKLYFAQVKDGAAAFTVNQNILVQNKKGLFDNKLSVNKEVDSTKTNYEDWFLTLVGDGKTPNPNAFTPGAAYNAAFALWRDDDTLLKRLGELRYNQDDQGIWARFTNKRLERDGRHGFEGNFKTLQVGLDKEKKTAHHGSWYYGGAVSHLWGNTDYEQGHGSQKATDFTFYGTNLRPQGHYLDLVARVGRIDSDYDSAYGDHGSFQNWGSSIGAEYGRKKTLRNGWSLEPQAQLTYNYLWGDDYTTRNGARVHQDNADSLVGRLGFVLGREFHENAKNPSRVYLKASVLHDFLGDTTSRISDDLTYTDTDDLGDTWYVVGIGTNIQFADNTQFYFDAEKSFCADVDMKYRFNAGIRFEF